jgi:hypothetical protein
MLHRCQEFLFFGHSKSKTAEQVASGREQRRVRKIEMHG